MNRKFRYALSLAIASTMLPAAPVAASGYVSMPDVHETLPSYRACLARLQAAYAQDRASEKPKTIAVDGSMSAASLETRTNGIERTARNRARYHGRVWYANGRISAHDVTQIEVSHSWEEHELSCAGRQLTTKSANGYTLSTFEPIDIAPTDPAAKAQ